MPSNLFLSTSNSNSNTVIDTNYLELNQKILNGEYGVYKLDVTIKIQVPSQTEIQTYTESLILYVFDKSYNYKGTSIINNDNVVYSFLNFGISQVDSEGLIINRNIKNLDGGYSIDFDFKNIYFKKYATLSNYTGFTEIDNTTTPIVFYTTPFNIFYTEISETYNLEISDSYAFIFKSDSVNSSYRTLVSFQNSSIKEVQGSVYYSITCNNGYGINIKNTLLQNVFLNIESPFCIIENSEVKNSNILRFASRVSGSVLSNIYALDTFIVSMLNATLLNCKESLGYRVDLANCTTNCNNENLTGENCISYIRNVDLLKISYLNALNIDTKDIAYLPTCFLVRTLYYTSGNVNYGSVFQSGTDVAISNIAVNIAEATIISNGINQFNSTVIPKPVVLISEGVLKAKTIIIDTFNDIKTSFEFIVDNI